MKAFWKVHKAFTDIINCLSGLVSQVMLIIYCFQCLVYFLYDVGRNYFLLLDSYDTCFPDLTETHNKRVPITGCK